VTYSAPIMLLSKPMVCRLRLKCDGTRAETRFRLSAKRTSPFKSADASVQSTTGSWGVRISGSNAGYTMFRGSVTSTGYPLHSPVAPSLPLPCVTVCHPISNGFYFPIGLRDNKHACALFWCQLRTGYWKQHLTFCIDCIFKQNKFYEEYEKVMDNSKEKTRRTKLARCCKVA
jgi:hypothetical protein